MEKLYNYTILLQISSPKIPCIYIYIYIYIYIIYRCVCVYIYLSLYICHIVLSCDCNLYIVICTYCRYITLNYTATSAQRGNNVAVFYYTL